MMALPHAGGAQTESGMDSPIGLKATPPFSLHLTASHQTYYQREFGADRYDGGVYSRVLVIDDAPCLARVSAHGSPDAPGLRLELAGDGVSPQKRALAAREVARILSLDVSLGPFYEAVQNDPFLGEATRQMYGLHPPQTGSVYEALVMAIIGQQISGVAARSIRARVVRELGTPFVMEGQEHFAFPRPEALLQAGQEKLRSLGLSGRKVEYIQGIAGKALEGALEQQQISEMGNDEVVEALTSIRGVGQWTAQWVLLRALGRADAFPGGDLVLQRLIGEMYFGGRAVGEKEAVAFARERWAGYTGFATTYLFAYIRRRALQERGELVQGA